MDLSPYIARGFPGNFDAALANVTVAGLDREQTLGIVRVCEATETYIYEGDYSPREIAYTRDMRPVLEAIAAPLAGDSPYAVARSALAWVYENVDHPFTFGPVPPDRAMSEEQLIASGVGWCNEQARVFIALCEVREIPGRLLFEFHANECSGHTVAEVYVDGKWVFFDPTFNVTVTLPDGTPAEGRELSGAQRAVAHEAYRPRLEAAYQRFRPCAEEALGWRRVNRPPASTGGDLLATLGVCNYLINGVRPCLH